MSFIKIRPNKKRGQIVLSLLFTMIILQIIIDIRGQFLGRRIIEDFTPPASDAFFSDLPMLLLNAAISIIYVLSIVYYIRWFRRAYFNLNIIASPLRYKNGWAAGSWFIPVFHWIGPFQIMIELYSKTRLFLVKNNIQVPGKWIFILLGVWWFLYFISGLIGIYSMFSDHINLQEFHAFKGYIEESLISNIIQLLLTLSAFIVVLIYYNLERLLELTPKINVIKMNKESSGLIDNVDSIGSLIDILE
jgi:ABC-type multidrug transport system fused ATPase/permease subunit